MLNISSRSRLQVGSQSTYDSAVLLVNLLGMVCILALDIADGSRIWSHILYVFPISTLAYYCERLPWVIVGLVASAVFQLLTLVAYKLPTADIVANLGIALATHCILIRLARLARFRVSSLELLATTDALTGLLNRRGFERVAEREVARHRRYGGTFSVVYLDLDRFKALNDADGHEAGDRALRLISDILRDRARSSDTVARVGGDEFVILMPNLHRDACAAFCTALSTAIAERMSAGGFKLTASVGFSTSDVSSATLARVMKVADDAMYCVKSRR